MKNLAQMRLDEIAIWVGCLGTFSFLTIYTILGFLPEHYAAKWWKTAAGRVIWWLDAAFFLVFVRLWLELTGWVSKSNDAWNWLAVVGLMIAVLIPVYRTVLMVNRTVRHYIRLRQNASPPNQS